MKRGGKILFSLFIEKIMQSAKGDSDEKDGTIQNGSLPEHFIGEKEWFFLYWVAYFKFKNNEPISTSSMESMVPLSQQTISRRAIDLENRGYLNRIPKGRTHALELTAQGFIQLQKISNNLNKIFKYESYSNVFSGRLKSGFGEGAYYIQKKQYLKQFKKKLGWEPYFGTLNVQIDPEVYELLIEGQDFNNVPPILIEGFKGKVREFGDVECYRVHLWTKNNEENKVEGALLQIQRTAHKKYILEFIAPHFLRNYWGIKDGDLVFFQFTKKGK